MSSPLIFNEVERRIITIRDIKVILDSDVADLYGVETKRVNEAVRNNNDKFPDGYLLQLSREEWYDLKSKISTSFGAGGKVKLPVAFTEKGLYMLATILKSNKATETTIAIVEAFAKLRLLTTNIANLQNTRDEERKKSLMQEAGEVMTHLFDDALKTSNTETTIEFNLAVVKVKHTIMRK
jgi:phage regulator Rha-like protein